MKDNFEELVYYLENNLENKEEAYVNIYSDYSDEEDIDQCKIEGNKVGIQLFALKLLNATSKFNQLEELNEDNRLIKIENNNCFKHEFNEEGFFVDPIYKTKKEIEYEERNSVTTVKDKLSEYGCFFLLFLLAVSIIVGFFEILSWIKEIISV